MSELKFSIGRLRRAEKTSQSSMQVAGSGVLLRRAFAALRRPATSRPKHPRPRSPATTRSPRPVFPWPNCPPSSPSGCRVIHPSQLHAWAISRWTRLIAVQTGQCVVWGMPSGDACGREPPSLPCWSTPRTTRRKPSTVITALCRSVANQSTLFFRVRNYRPGLAAKFHKRRRTSTVRFLVPNRASTLRSTSDMRSSNSSCL